jgi:NTP pyrophosphatase (non-canonical NTP hydrolase)
MQLTNQITAEYLQLIDDTCVNQSWEALYYGLMGEVGELAEIYKRHYRGDKHFQFDKPIIQDAIKKECGDILWYLTAIHKYHGNLDVNYFADTPDCVLSSMQLFPMFTNTIYEAYLRKNKSDVSNACMRGVFALAQIASCYNYSLEEIIDTNIQKLTSRKERGVLTGVGGDR